MNDRRISLFIGCVIVAVALYVSLSKRTDTSNLSRSNVGQARPVQISSNAEALVQPSNGTARQTAFNTITEGSAAVRKVMAFAAAAPLYKFEATVTNYNETTNTRLGNIAIVGTRSHVAQIYNDKLVKISSLNDGSDTRRNPGAEREWYKGTNAWTEEQAIDQTLAILRSLNDTKTLEAISKGRQEVQPYEYPTRGADGEQVIGVPFNTIRLYDTNDVLRVLAEFSHGTEWSSRLN